MKKLLGVLIITLTMISSTFALGLSFGGKGLVGGRMYDINNTVETKKFDRLSYGGGAYLNFELFGGLGVQAETNFVHNQLTGINYIDIPIMGWWELSLFDLFKFGFGGGLNISRIVLSDQNFGDVFSIGKGESWNQGIAVGANMKIFFNTKIGLVIGANGVFELKPNEIFNNALNGNIKGIILDDDTKRREIYANIGLEYKLF